jgi:gamma-glutamylcyclotransferase (GGCT)/AIG2-like uncharacterized protein YtfP
LAPGAVTGYTGPPMQTAPRHLFVYGTLKSAASGALGHAHRARLTRESRSLGAATMAGAALYDLGRYPGLVETGRDNDIVHGEVLLLLNPKGTFAWLDPYEDISPNDPENSAYSRLERPIGLAHGKAVSAWVYVFLRDVANRRLVSGGRW